MHHQDSSNSNTMCQPMNPFLSSLLKQLPSDVQVVNDNAHAHPMAASASPCVSKHSRKRSMSMSSSPSGGFTAAASHQPLHSYGTTSTKDRWSTASAQSDKMPSSMRRSSDSVMLMKPKNVALSMPTRRRNRTMSLTECMVLSHSARSSSSGSPLQASSASSMSVSDTHDLISEALMVSSGRSD
mmetsp:Transcript_15289/g.43095  ORF Transcript_15289/g.43095 Transcript_15289/m.43095 type:complete len:184 (-) Transcript_15289:137-688(-)